MARASRAFQRFAGEDLSRWRVIEAAGCHLSINLNVPIAWAQLFVRETNPYVPLFGLETGREIESFRGSGKSR